MNKNVHLGLILAIIFASAAVSGSLVFFGLQMMGNCKGGAQEVSVEKIEQAFEGFVKKQQSKQEQQQAEEQAAIKAEADRLAVNVKKVDSTEHIRGDKNAPVSLIEYSDFECPYCKDFHLIAKQLIEVSGSEVNWVYRHWPLDFHDPMATNEAMASECVAEAGGNEAFWKFVDAAYAKTQSGGNGLKMDDIVLLASQSGVDGNKVKLCVESNKYLDKIKKDIAEGAQAGISGTPGNILINNKTGAVKALRGGQKLSALQDAIRGLLQ